MTEETHLTDETQNDTTATEIGGTLSTELPVTESSVATTPVVESEIVPALDESITAEPIDLAADVHALIDAGEALVEDVVEKIEEYVNE